MSVHVLARFMDKTSSSLGARLVGMVLSDSAGDDGICWLSQEKLIKWTGLSERGVRDAIRTLEGLEEVECRKAQRGRSRINVYRVWCSTAPDYERLPFTLDAPFSRPPANSAGRNSRLPAVDDHDHRQFAASTPSLEQQKNVREHAPLENGRAKNVVWDALVEVFGEPTTASATKLRGKVCSSLTQAGATPEEIVSRAKSWPRHFENATLTDLALEKHWDKLGRPPLRVNR